jgi:hypothetical protein
MGKAFFTGFHLQISATPDIKGALRLLGEIPERFINHPALSKLGGRE